MEKVNQQSNNKPETQNEIINQAEHLQLIYQERQKYKTIWQRNNYGSGNLMKFSAFVHPIISGKCLEIGCGDGRSVKYLNDNFRVVSGLDLTLEGIKKTFGDQYFYSKLKFMFYEGSITKTEFVTDCFHCTFSTDVLEHLPPQLVDMAIKEIFRITKPGGKTIHSIATREAIHKWEGYTTHLTVQPLKWWIKKFKEFNNKGIEVILKDADKL